MKNYIAPEEEVKRRIDKVFDFISEMDIDGILIFNEKIADDNFFYLTGFGGGVFENCGVFIARDGFKCIITTKLEEQIAETSSYEKLYVYKNSRERNNIISKILVKYKNIGICYDKISYEFFNILSSNVQNKEWINIGYALRKARMIKTDYEIEKIRTACRIVGEVESCIPDILEDGLGKGITETDLSVEIDYLMRKKGASGIAFDTIVAFGKNTSLPHYRSGTQIIKPNQPVLIDYGAEYSGYCADITRTYITGKPDKWLLDIYSTVVSAYKIAIENMREGASSEEVEKKVRDYIDSYDDYRGKFIHRLGHSIGISVHDDGYPDTTFKNLFFENMTLTVEPGIYLAGKAGVRLEDDVRITKDGVEILNVPLKPLEDYLII